MLKIILKLVLFPVTIVLSLLVVILYFIADYGGAITNILASLFFLLGVMLVLGKLFGKLDSSTSWGICSSPFIFSFLLSPYGIVGVIVLLADNLDDFNNWLRYL